MTEEKETDTEAISLSKQEGIEPVKRWRGRSPRETGKAEVGGTVGRCEDVPGTAQLKFSFDLFCCLTRL